MIYWDRLEIVLEDFFTLPSDTTYIVSPFINPELLENILSEKWDQEVVVITSWRTDHLLSGVSKLETYDVIKRHKKWSLRVKDNLHTKLYSHDMSSTFLGSANLTYSALQDNQRSNHEVLKFVELSSSDKESFNHLISSSKLVDDDYYQLCLEWYNENKDKYQRHPRESIVEQESRDWFKISSLPASISPSRIWDIKVNNAEPELDWGEDKAAEHDLELFEMNIEDYHDLNQFKRELAIKVSSHPFISSFTEAIDLQGMYFGRAKEWIQYNCTDDPVPYRRELTDYTDSIFNWLAELFPADYIVERPNYSQLIRKSR